MPSEDRPILDTMDSMTGTVAINAEERADIRLRFFREHRSLSGLSSVAVRRDRDAGQWFLDVAASGPLAVDASYMGLEVRVRTAPGAVNAVGPIDQVS